MKATVFIALFTILSGCASKSDVASSTPSYVSPDSAAPQSSQPPISSNDPSVMEGQATGEAVYFIASGLASSARKSSHSNMITGLVVCHKSPTELMQLPCGSVKVTLKDVGGRPVTSGILNGGEFAFQVPPNTKYRIETDSKIFAEEKRAAMVEAGSDRILHLYQKK